MQKKKFSNHVPIHSSHYFPMKILGFILDRLLVGS